MKSVGLLKCVNCNVQSNKLQSQHWESQKVSCNSMSLGKKHSSFYQASVTGWFQFTFVLAAPSFICPLGSLSWNLLFGNCVIFRASDHLLKSCALHANPAYPKCSLEFGTYYSSHFHMVTRRAILHSKRVFGLQSVITSL